jgi:hypothetical protein
VSAEIINLRQARKQRARDEKAAQSAENRARFGRTKAERDQEERAQALAGRALDGHLREPPSIVAPAERADTTDHAQPLEPSPKPPR